MAEDGIKMNWPAIVATLLGLIGIGWCFGLLVHPPQTEVLHCASESEVQIVEENGEVVVFCKDYRD